MYSFLFFFFFQEMDKTGYENPQPDPLLLVNRRRKPHDGSWARDLRDDLLDRDVRADRDHDGRVVDLGEGVGVVQDGDAGALQGLRRSGAQVRVLREAADLVRPAAAAAAARRD